MNPDINFFIDKFESIPDDRWYDGGNYASEDGSKFCALGHCFGMYDDTSMGHFLCDRLSFLFFRKLNLGVVNVNDNKTIEYQQSTPKARILAALNDIKKATNE